MANVKRPWLTYTMIGGLALLLGVLGVFQYRWLTRISESDGEKARVRLRDQTERFAADFNREIQNAYFNLQAGPEVWKEKDWTEFARRFEFWKRNAAYPDLVAEVFYIPKDGGPALKFDPANATFHEPKDSEQLTRIRELLADEKNFRPVDITSFTLLLPIHEAGERMAIKMRAPAGEPTLPFKMPERLGHLAIRLDPAVIREQILPALTDRYFGDGEYGVSIDERNGTYEGSPDATAPLFELISENFVFYANRDTVSALDAEKHDVMVNSHVESHSFRRIESSDANSTVKIELKTDKAKPRTSVFTATAKGGDSPWMLAVQHASGSLDSYIASTLRQNLALGFGILLLVAGAAAAIIISSMRARRLAQRQIDFVSSVSHEFRTPLAVIFSAGENLADGVAKENSQVSRYGDLIKGEGRKLSSMVEQILEFAGANAGKRKFKFAPTAVEDVVMTAVEETRSLLDDRGFEIETSITSGLGQISADETALGRAIQNLIANAIKYCNGKPWLRVSASNGNGKVRIAVEDRGIGIARGDLKNIFDPFFRSKDVVNAQIHGNGLGLSLVKQIVDAHGGTIHVESEPGVGSRFTIELPSEKVK